MAVLNSPFSSSISNLVLSSMLAQQVHKQPSALAVIDSKGGGLSFRELHDKACNLVALLHYQNHASSCVGLYVDASPELIVGVWGIVCAGRSYLPLSPDYPDERIRYIVEHSQVDVIVTQAHLLERIRAIAPTGTQCLVLGQEAQGGNGVDVAISRQATPSDLAYVIYTSGSTGRPKGVMIEQRSIVSQLCWLADQGYLLAQDRILQKTPMSFDAAQWEILAPAVGATVVAGSPGLYRDTKALIQSIQRHAVTRLQCVPTLLHALVEDEAMASCSSLRTVFSGGEALSQKLAAQCKTVLAQCELINLYGPTETTINATWHAVGPSDMLHPDQSVPIGRPVAGCSCHVLNEHMQPVAPGQEGDLYIAGVQVARGYLHDPEQTAQRFVPSPFSPTERLYRTGDRCLVRDNGVLHFSGRADHQVKLRGYRVELEEISTAIESHPWVRLAAAIVTEDPRHGGQVLNACIELNEKEAALMDQGLGSSHHQSKANKLQVKAQLSYPGLRECAEDDENQLFYLPGEQAPLALRQTVFSRKTYRFFEGEELTLNELQTLCASWFELDFKTEQTSDLHIIGLGHALRWMGSFHSPERLLPKYSYASPGALYATQLYLECNGLAGLADGLYYYHPVRHALLYVAPALLTQRGLRWHFTGKRSAIEPVYQHNIREVLEIEAGHMVATLQEALAPLGCGLQPMPCVEPPPEVPPYAFGLAADDFYLGAFDCVSPRQNWKPDVDLFVQPVGHGVVGLHEGTYSVSPSGFTRVSSQSIQARHVIAINQQVFQRSSVGISVVSRSKQAWLDYIALGHVLHIFQRNGLGLGFMSSGYSSKTGHSLPAFRQLQAALAHADITAEAGYFFIGGKVSQAQRQSEGMQEDSVHMQGPAEMIRDELARTLPDYMIPNRVLVFDRLPQTANGKVDRQELAADNALRNMASACPFVEPATFTERWLANVWEKALHYSPISTEDDFFALGGNSLVAIASLHQINQAFSVRIPAQLLFESPRLGDLAARIDVLRAASPAPHTAVSRCVNLNAVHQGAPLFCWPGLGGYPMNLRGLAQALPEPRPFFGIQSHGLHEGETPFSTIEDMAAADVLAVQALQPTGPLTLWGYSFGARLAFETAWQLEQAGREVESLVLICPGNPTVDALPLRPKQRDASLSNRTYLAILLSVFLGEMDLNATDRFLAEGGPSDAHHFAAFVQSLRPEIEQETIVRIMNLVAQTYEFEYSFSELNIRKVRAPIVIVKARGDDYSFIENANDYADKPPVVHQLPMDHYAVLRSGVQDLVKFIHRTPLLAQFG